MIFICQGFKSCQVFFFFQKLYLPGPYILSGFPSKTPKTILDRASPKTKEGSDKWGWRFKPLLYISCPGVFRKTMLARALSCILLYILSRLYLKPNRALASSGIGAQAAVDSLSRQLRYSHCRWWR